MSKLAKVSLKPILGAPAQYKLPNSRSILYTTILMRHIHNKLSPLKPLQLLLSIVSLHSLSDSVLYHLSEASVGLRSYCAEDTLEQSCRWQI